MHIAGLKIKFSKKKLTGWLSYWPQKGQKGTFWAISALEHSKVCTHTLDFGHLQFNVMFSGNSIFSIKYVIHSGSFKVLKVKSMKNFNLHRQLHIGEFRGFFLCLLQEYVAHFEGSMPTI
jgi:hypothetical protein